LRRPKLLTKEVKCLMMKKKNSLNPNHRKFDLGGDNE